MDTNRNNIPDELIKVIRLLIKLVIFLVVSLLVLPPVFYYRIPICKSLGIIKTEKPTGEESQIANAIPVKSSEESVYWKAPDVDTITNISRKEKIAYGRDLIAHTSRYLGPKGTVMKISNGMNCQNCHLDAGTRVWGNNYGSVASLYPKFRARSGSVENIYKRVNDCIERSLNGKSLDSTGKEMQAIKSYIEFLGSNMEKGEKAAGSGLKELPFLDRAADPLIGKTVYALKCKSCHQEDGGGTLLADGMEYLYPPMWGENSYSDGAGLYRLSNFARYIKNNMPLGATHQSPQLNDEEVWDLAAYVNSQPRPHKNVPEDWPDISKKPIDHPFGPYADGFSEHQHKYGPFKPIAEAQKKKEQEAKQSVASAKKKITNDP